MKLEDDEDKKTKCKGENIAEDPKFVTRKRLCGPSRKPNKSDYPKHLLHEHRCRLTHLLRAFFDDHNWKDAAAALSVLLQSAPRGSRGYPLMELRKNFQATMEVVSRCGETKNYPTQIKQIYDIWMSKLTFNVLKERLYLQLELALFFLKQGKISEAHQVTKFLLQDRESASEPKVHLLHGLVSYQLWYSTLPLEMQLKQSDMHIPLETIKVATDSVLCPKESTENLHGHNATEKQEMTLSTANYSDSSVDNHKKVIMCGKRNRKELHQVSPSDGYGANVSAEISGIGPLNWDKSIEEISIFFPSGLDASLLPISLEQFFELTTEDKEQSIYCYRKLLNENYMDAVSHLRAALYFDPPLLAALLPLIQVHLLGDHVEEALKEVKKFCQLSNATLPFRLRARLLESFCSNQFIDISNCHETVLRKDPTCSYSLERLIKMFKDGNYSSINLLEMIALHLDSSPGNCNIWGEFASCLLSVQTAQSEYEQDQMSTNGPGQHFIPSSSTFIPFQKQDGRQTWGLRFRWWLKVHFGKHIYLSEAQAGNWKLLTFKAACASHLYGSSSKYVRDVHGGLQDPKDVNNLSFLERHINNSLMLCETLSRISW